jgi:hypothetical protein
LKQTAGRFCGEAKYRGKGRRVQYWVRMGYWISPCYGPFLLGVHFETYEPFIPFISTFFSGCSEPQIHH